MTSRQSFPGSSNSTFRSPLKTSAGGTGSNTLVHSAVSDASGKKADGPWLARADSGSYDEHASLLNNIGQANAADYKTASKHLADPKDQLKMQGGDVARYLHSQIGHAAKTDQRRMTRSSSFSDLRSELRRESAASDINVPGGFRREFLINRSLQQNKAPPNFLTRNFVEFLSIYGHFAGEDFADDDDDEEETDDAPDDEGRFEDVFDEELALMQERVPSLPQKRPRKRRDSPKGTASQLKTFFLLFKALVGSGVLFLPKAFHNGGLLFSTLAMTAFGFLTFLCYIILIKSKKVLGKSSFGELGYLTYGKPLKYSIMVSIIISQIGFVATYILFAAENIISFSGSLFHVYISERTMVLIQCILLIPLVLIRDLTKLSFTSFTSSVFILVGLVIIFWFLGLQLVQHGPGPNIVNFNPSTWSMLVGVAVTSFEGIGLILPIEASMERPERFPWVLLASMISITALFVMIGVVGYSAFGDKVKSIIILNLPQANPAVQLITVLYSVAVFLTGPLQLFPAIKIGESLIFNSTLFIPKNHKRSSSEGRLYHTSGKYNPHIKWMKNLFRAIFVVSISFLAYANANNIDKFVSLNGCFACIPLVYIYPPLIHLKTYKRGRRQWDVLKAFDYILIVVGVMAVIYTTYQILFAIE